MTKVTIINPTTPAKVKIKDLEDGTWIRLRDKIYIVNTVSVYTDPIAAFSMDGGYTISRDFEGTDYEILKDVTISIN